MEEQTLLCALQLSCLAQEKTSITIKPQYFISLKFSFWKMMLTLHGPGLKSVTQVSLLCSS